MAERRFVQFGSVVSLKSTPDELQVVLGMQYYQRQLRLGRLIVTEEGRYALAEYMNPFFGTGEIGSVLDRHMDEVQLVEALRHATALRGEEMNAAEIDGFIHSLLREKTRSIIINHE